MRTVTPHPARYGHLTCSVYDFLADGDELPLHTHTADDVHISIVTVAPLTLFGDINRLVVPGEIIDWQPGQHHGFRYAGSPSRLINIQKVLHAST